MNTNQMSKVELSFVTFGIIMGIVGILHGSAELLRGNEIVTSFSTEAMPANWPNPEFYSMTRGSPVKSILTGLPFYALGLLAISVSVTIIVYMSKWFKLNKAGIAFFALLSVGVFLFGAGQGTPIAVSIPLIIFGIQSLVRTSKKQRSAASMRRNLSLFNFFYGLNIFSWVLFFPGLFIWSFYAPIPTWLFIFDFMAMPLATILALIFGSMVDRTEK